jgi:hypothetical protein
MSKKIVAEMKIMYDAASAMTVLVNKEFRKTHTDFYEMRNGMENELSNKRNGLQMTKKMKKQAKVRTMRKLT